MLSVVTTLPILIAGQCTNTCHSCGAPCGMEESGFGASGFFSSYLDVVVVAFCVLVQIVQMVTVPIIVTGITTTLTAGGYGVGLVIIMGCGTIPRLDIGALAIVCASGVAWKTFTTTITTSEFVVAQVVVTAVVVVVVAMTAAKKD